MKLSKNKSDYIFCLAKDPFSLENNVTDFVAYITPSNFFYKKGHMYDQHLPIKISGWSDISEGIYSPDKQNTEEILKDQLSAKGFIWAEDFDKFINRNKRK
jgi:hypothetical protein